MKKVWKNIVKLKKISTIKDFGFRTFPSISGSGSGYTFDRPPIPTDVGIFRYYNLISGVRRINIFTNFHNSFEYLYLRPQM